MTNESGGRARRRCAPLLAALGLIAAGCSGGADSATSPATGVPSTSAATPPHETVSAVTVEPTVTPPTTPVTSAPVTIRVVLPPVDADVAAATAEELAAPILVQWLAGAFHAADTAAECPSTYTAPLDVDQFGAILGLSDAVVGELIVNLDASLGAAAEWCRRGDPAAASTESADAAVSARMLKQRLNEIGAPTP